MRLAHLLAFVMMLGCRSRVPIPQTPTRWVTDGPGAMSAHAREGLDGRLKEYQQMSGHQLIVWIDRKLPKGVSPEVFGLLAFNSWGIGRQGRDDGVVLFVFTEEPPGRGRRFRIQVGYGLERQLSDRYCQRVIDDLVTPAMDKGNADDALTRGMTAIMQTIDADKLRGWTPK